MERVKGPYVSVIMAAYNSERYIGHSIRSVQQQSFENWELIVSDDCSTDGTPSTVEILRKADKRIRLLTSEDNHGPAVARNRAIEGASGRHIAFLDSDDIWFSEKLERQIDFARSKDAKFTCGLCNLVRDQADGTGYEDLRTTLHSPERLTYRRMLLNNYVQSPTAMYDSEAIGKQYMPLIRKRQDYALWLQILRLGHTCWCIQEPLALYRVGRKGSVSNSKVDAVRYNWRLYREIEGLSLPVSFWALANCIIRAPLRRRGVKA